MSIQAWFPLGLNDLIAFQSFEFSKVFPSTTICKNQFEIWKHSAFFMVQLSHPYMTTGKTIALAKRTFVGKLMSLILIWCLETMETVKEFIFLGSKITVNGDCSHEIKRHLFLGRKATTNLDSVLKNRDITLLTKVRLVKTMVFPAVMYGCESWTIKKAEHWGTDAFKDGEDSWESLR